MENTSSTQLERLGGGTRENGKCDVGLGFFVDTIPDELRGKFCTLSPGERRVISVYMD
jgi:hypothetical protein